MLFASTMPLLGRTQYFLGEVVFTLNATRLPVVLVSVIVTGMFLRISNLQENEEGENLWRGWIDLYITGLDENALESQLSGADGYKIWLHVCLIFGFDQTRLLQPRPDTAPR